MGGGLPGRGLRRPRRRDGPARARGAGLPGRHPVREPGRHDRRADHAAAGHRRGLRPPRRDRRDDQGRGGRGARRRRRPARRPVDRHHVLGLLHRRRPSATSPTPRRQDTAAYAAFFHAMLDRGVYLPPSAYEAWFVSAAHDDRAVETVLDALPDAAARQRPPAGGAGMSVRDHRPPAPPRGGAQPRGRALRPPRRLPPLRPREADGTAGGRHHRRPRHRPPRGVSRWSERRRPPARSPRRAAWTSPQTSGSSSRPTSSRAAPSPTRAGSCATRRCGGTSGTRSSPPGVSRTPTWRRGCAPPSSTPAARREGHEAVLVSHQLPIWMARLSGEGRPFLHDPRRRQCTLCSLTSFHFADDRLDRVTYSEPAGDLIPVTRQGGHLLRGRGSRGAAPVRRAPILAPLLALLLVLALTGCESVGSTGDKGYISGDGQILQYAGTDRDDARRADGHRPRRPATRPRGPPRSGRGRQLLGGLVRSLPGGGARPGRGRHRPGGRRRVRRRQHPGLLGRQRAELRA